MGSHCGGLGTSRREKPSGRGRYGRAGFDGEAREAGRPAEAVERVAEGRGGVAVLRLPRGEDGGEVSREVRVAPPELERWAAGVPSVNGRRKSDTSAIENLTPWDPRRRGSGATGAGRIRRLERARIRQTLDHRTARPTGSGRRAGGWPWRVRRGVASGSCCRGC